MREIKPKDPRIIGANLDVSWMKEETEEEKAERYGNPDFDYEKMLEEEYNVKDLKAKCEEHKIDKEVFWSMEEGEYDKFGLEKFGTKRRLKQRVD